MKKACSCIDPAASTTDGRLANGTQTQKDNRYCKYAANPVYDALWGDYPNAGWGSQTFNLYNKSGQVFAAVGYNPQASPSAIRWFNQSESSMNTKIEENDALRS